MADVKISDLPAASTLSDADFAPLVQGGATKRGTVAQFRAGLAAAAHTHAVADTAGLQAALDAKQATAAKGQANGYAGLGASAEVPTDNLLKSVGASVSLSAPRALTAADQGKLIICEWSTDQDLPIPTGIPLNAGWTIYQRGVGRVRPVTAQGAGQAFEALNGALYSPGRYGSLSIYQVAANAWAVLGGVV